MPVGQALNTATNLDGPRTDLTNRLIAFLSKTSFRARLLGGVWLLFLILVAFGIHGSSIPFANQWWASERHYSGYVLQFLANLAPAGPRINDTALRELAMAEPRALMSDEWLVTTPLALPHLPHTHPFPL